MGGGSRRGGRAATIVSSAAARLGRVTSIALVIAGLCGMALVLAGFLAPMYQWTSVSSSGVVAHGSGTLVEVNGRGVLLVLVVPLLAAVLVAGVLWQRSWQLALPIAWTITGLLAGFNLLALMSIGVFFLPVTAALVVACSRCRPEPTKRDPATPPQPVVG